MTAIKGTNLAAPAVPFDTADTYPTHDSLYGKGGWREVADVTARDAIPTERRKGGMVVVCQDTGTAYQLANDLTTWNTLTTGGGGTSRYDIAVCYPAKPTDGQVLASINMVASVKLVAGLTGSKFSILTPPTVSAQFTLQKNGGSIGTITFAATGVPTVSFTADVTFSAGDSFDIVYQSPADATASYPSFTFVGEIVT